MDVISDHNMPSSKRAGFDDMSLPDDLVRVILLKLPSFKSMARLSCVCKSWYECNRDNHRRNFGERLSSQICSGCLMVFHERDGDYQIRTHNSENIWPVNLPQESRVEKVRECNGILCFEDADHPDRLHLYNPITREYWKLPPFALPQYGKLPPFALPQVFGFGFDTSNNDYKIIIYDSWSGEKVIYKLSTNCWSNLNVELGFNDTNDFDSVSVYVNGRCYWLYYANYGLAIVTFDFRTESFGYIRDGAPFESSKCCSLSLGVLDDSLAVCSLRLDTKENEVWVMSENGNWTKKFTIKLSSQLGRGSSAWVHDTNLFQIDSCDCRVSTLPTTMEAQNGRTRMFKVDDRYNRSVVFKPTLFSLGSGLYL